MLSSTAFYYIFQDLLLTCTVFLPLIAVDIFVERRNKRLQAYFWLELVIIFILVQQDLKIPLLSDLRVDFSILVRSWLYYIFLAYSGRFFDKPF